MRDQCVEAVTRAAVGMGRRITQTDLRGIEERITKAKTQLARADRDGWIKMSEAERLEKAGELAANEILHDALKRRQREELAIIKRAERDDALARMEKRGLSEVEAFKRYNFFVADNKGGVQSIESAAKAHSANWKRQLSDLWDLEHSNLINLFTNRQNSSDFMTELYGKASGNELAKKAADGYKALTEKIIKDMNDAGFDIGNLADYRSPQKLSWWKVWKAAETDRDAVIRDWMAHVDRKKYVNQDGTLMDDKQLGDFLNAALQTTMTNGLNKPKGQGSGSLSNRHSQHRQLHWKDAESFMYIMEKYSESNPVDMIWSQMDRMGREYALVQKYGPNPIDSFYGEVSRIAETATPKEKAELDILVDAFDHYVGYQPAITNPRTTRFFQNLRQAMSAVFLGSNTISQLGDQATLVATARAMNVPVAQAFIEQARQATSAADREAARSLGFGLESISTNISRIADSGGEGFWGKATNAVLTVNLSNHLTAAVRSGFGITMLSHIGSMARRFKSLDDLSPTDRGIMESKGVTPEIWNLWKEASSVPAYKDVMSPDAIANLSDDVVLRTVPAKVKEIMDAGLSEKGTAAKLAQTAEQARQGAITQLLGMTIEESHMASLQPSQLASRVGGRHLGDSELARVLFQFKQFPIAYFVQHIMQRSAMNGEGLSSRVAYTVPLVTASTVMGGLALMLGDIAAGRDPREVYDEEDWKSSGKFAVQAMTKGGGLGILGDLLNPETVLTTDPASQQLGPGAGYLLNVGQLVHKGIAWGLAEEGDREAAQRKVGAEAAQLIRSSIPGQNIWWARGVLNNYVLNDLNEFMAPGYKDRVRGAAEKNYGAGFWIGGEEGTRPPDFGNIIAQ
jgi:hypothetical protein